MIDEGNPYEIDHRTGRKTGRKILSKWLEIVREDISGMEPGDKLVAAYFAMGLGDRHDIPSTLIDMVAYLGHNVASKGLDFAACCTAAKETAAGAILDLEVISSSPAAATIRCLADLGSYCERRNYSFDDTLRVAMGHVGYEIENSEALQSSSLRLR